ncbi:MAG: ribokinase [Armatimonadetes bacterium]|nr:ribokinase [Armatimonadota bacterium]
MSGIVVVGSLNMDLVVKVPHLPAVGETVLGGEFATFPGGKGANQAVAAARLGAEVAMVGRVGDDAFGRALRDGLAADGVDVRHVLADPSAHTGVAFILVDAAGRNAIAVASGANMRLSPDDVAAAAEALAGARAVLLQLEVPLECVARAAALARESGALVILDPAPAVPLPASLIRLVDVIAPNEQETEVLTGIGVRSLPDAARAADALRVRGARAAVIKLGGRGAWVSAPEGERHLPALAVTPVDTTAAGDAFCGALGAALAEGQNLLAAARFANAAAGLSVTRMGAQPSMPRRAEVEGVLSG